MNRFELPVNISIMNTSMENMKRVPEITSLDTFETGGLTGGNFHPAGLFSTEIFGRVGSQQRMVAFGYINLKIKVFKPYIFDLVCTLRRLYKDILYGRAYAVWNAKDKDFEPSTLIDGETGYNFFMSHFEEIVFKRTDSDERDVNIGIVTKAIADGVAYTTTMLVIPAGLRDAYIEPDGRVSEDEINSRYRALLSAANALPDNLDLNNKIYDTTRCSIQNAINAIYEYLWNIFEGKRGFMYKNYYSRGIVDGTRGVLTAQDTRVEKLGDLNAPKLNNTVSGLFQTLKALLPVAQSLILKGWLSQVFNAGDSKAYLVNKTTLKRELVSVERSWYDSLYTPDGIAKRISQYFQREKRLKPVMYRDSHYIGLVYRGKINGKEVFRIFNDISELPKGFSRNDIHPLTWCELFYTAGYRVWNHYPVMFTRYPVAGLGSTYVSYIYVKTTTMSKECWELDDNWEIKEFNDANPIKSAFEYPDITDDKFFETIAVSPTRLAGASADFDGDLGSFNAFYTDESIEQVGEFLNSTRAYLNPKGGFLNSAMVETVERVLVGLMN